MSDAYKRELLAYLQQRIGPARAITAKELAHMFFGNEASERTVREIIANLITEDGHGEICANPGGEAFKGYPQGYFWADDWRQIDAYYNQLVSRYDEIRHRMNAAWDARQRLARAPRQQAAMPI